MTQTSNVLKVFYLITSIYLMVAWSCNNKNIITRNVNHEINNLIEINQNKKGKVIFTLDPECPLCKSYTKEINYLFQKYQHEIDFFNVFPTKKYAKKTTNDFIQKNKFNIPTIIDTNHIITNYLDAKVTPECFLLDSNLNIIYNGLINDWVKELGRKGQPINNHYLEDNINLFLNKKPIIINHTKAIGCIIQKN